MAASMAMNLALLCLSMIVAIVRGEDPYLYFTWNVSYGTIAPLGVPQQGILINGQFPGPNINSTTNNNIVVNVFNLLDESLMFTWHGTQQKNSWQDGTPGTMCTILPGQNYTYHFQVKDQIGSYFYYPITAMHRAGGAFCGLSVNSRNLIPVPYANPEDDYTVLIVDWYMKSHKSLKYQLDMGRSLGRSDSVLVNGKNVRGDDTDESIFSMQPGKTYKFRVCNVGLKNSLNFRIQGNTMKLVEMEGSHVVQNTYESLDVHLGQCFAVLVTTDKELMDYWMVADTRFIKTMLTGLGLIQYTNSKGPAHPELPLPPEGLVWSINQARSFRWNLTANAARPNPQGYYHYGAINITCTIKLVNSASIDDGKLRYAINAVSHVDTETPLKYAEYFGGADKVFKYDIINPSRTTPAEAETKITLAPNVVNQTYRNFVEIIFENHGKNIQSWHLNGHTFFPVAIEFGRWAPEKRRNYNLMDAISRHTVQVYPGSWAAIMLTFDNAITWNLRSAQPERAYLGQQLYISVENIARSLREEYMMLPTTPLCGIVKDLPKPPPYVP